MTQADTAEPEQGDTGCYPGSAAAEEKARR
jgi:hypothetical protein